MSFQSRFKLRKGQKVWVALLATFICITILLLRQDRGPQVDVLKKFHQRNQESRFANFSNEVGADEFIVPNIVHFIVFEKPNISFIHFVCILAALRNQKPEKIYMHTNVDNFTGQYWTRLMALEKFSDILEIRKIEMPSEIFNQTIRPDMRIFHGGDIARIQILLEYGGIYLDNDSYIVKSLDFFRKFEMSIGWDEGEFLGTQIILANKDARFLHLWLHTYDGAYYTDQWYFNAGEFPTTSVLLKRPDLVHRVKLLFGNKTNFIYKLFQEYWPDWKNNYAFHLLARRAHQSVLKSISESAPYPVDFDEYNLQNYPITFREMANEVLEYEILLKATG